MSNAAKVKKIMDSATKLKRDTLIPTEGSPEKKKQEYIGRLLDPKNTEAQEYLESRGFSREQISEAELGYCEERKAIVIPAKKGLTFQGFLYHSIAEQQTTSQELGFLVGLPAGDPKREKDLLLVLDPLDALLLNAKGFFDVAAIGNSVLTPSQLAALKDYNPRTVVLLRTKGDEIRQLEENLRKQFRNETIPHDVIYTDPCATLGEYLQQRSLTDLKNEIAKANTKVLDPIPNTADELVSWLNNRPPALVTGLEGFDDTFRIAQGAVTIIAGRPKHGKTKFLYNLMLSMAESEAHEDKKFYFFSYEEGAKQLVTKMLQRTVEKLAPGKKGRSAYFEDRLKEYAKNPSLDPDIQRASKSLSDALRRVEVSTDAIPVEELVALIGKLNEREKIGAVFIDYIQNVDSKESFKDLRLTVKHVSKLLRICAKDTGLPLFVGAQLNRASAAQEKPSANNLKESGAIEEDANQVLCVFNKDQDQTDKSNKAPPEETVEVFTLCSRDTKYASKTFTMTNRYFGE